MHCPSTPLHVPFTGGWQVPLTHVPPLHEPLVFDHEVAFEKV